MSPASMPRDPRGFITPEAFHVSPELMGLPLAAPGRRLAAVLLDLVLIGILTAVTRSFALILGIVVAVALVRAGFKRTPVVAASALDRARRIAVGCLGLWVGFVTVVVGAAILIDSVDDGGERSATAFDLGSATVTVVGDEPPSGDPVTPGDADTITALLARLSELELEMDRAERRLEQDEAGSGGFLGWLAGIADELGFGFGWAALYTTVLLVATNGQTAGKRALGIRVVRLDGQRINWWVAFERAGGYAAGFATGLLGFAQIYWDANRQAIHDRIVGTVVVREGAERVSDWNAAP